MAPLDARAAVAGRYVVGELLGRGGMGEVYDARDLRLDRPVALKRVRADLAHDPAMRRRVETEARSAARLVHPNVVTVFDSGVDRGHPFIVMERLEGRTLRDELEDGPLPADEVRTLALQILDALAAAHEIGLIHRDVKPGNVLAAPGGTWKVADFGIATSSDADHTLTRTGELLGSPSYLAPERLEGRPATLASDLYSLGVLLYEAVSGVRPFGEGNAFALASRIREGHHQPIREVAPEVDPGIAGAIERAMSHDPAARFVSAEEMAAALLEDGPGGPHDMADTAIVTSSADPTAVLEPVVHGPDETSPTETSSGEGSAPPVSPDDDAVPERAPRRLLAVLVGAAVIVVLLVVGVVVLTTGDDPSSADGGAPARSAAPSAGVPAPLHDALDRLQETITP
jgi:serine/threonine protein kinase